MEPFITGWLGVSLAQQQAKNVDKSQLHEGEYVVGVDDALWILPNSPSETYLLSIGVVFGE